MNTHFHTGYSQISPACSAMHFRRSDRQFMSSVEACFSDRYDTDLNQKLERVFCFLKTLSEKIYQRNVRNLVDKCEKEGCSCLLQVEELDLSHCSITDLPGEVGVMKNVRVFNLANNCLTDLPEALVGMKETLKELDLTGNQFTDFPKVVYDIAAHRIQNQKYMELYLGFNPMRYVPKKLEDITVRSPSYGNHFSTDKSHFPHIFKLQ